MHVMFGFSDLRVLDDSFPSNGIKFGVQLLRSLPSTCRMTYYYQISAVNFVGVIVITVILVIFQDLYLESKYLVIVVIADIVIQDWFPNFFP